MRPWRCNFRIGQFLPFTTQCRTASFMAGSDGSFGMVVAPNSEVLALNPDRVGCLSLRLRIYSAANPLKTWSVQYSLWHYAL